MTGTSWATAPWLCEAVTCNRRFPDPSVIEVAVAAARWDRTQPSMPASNVPLRTSVRAEMAYGSDASCDDSWLTARLTNPAGDGEAGSEIDAVEDTPTDCENAGEKAGEDAGEFGCEFGCETAGEIDCENSGEICCDITAGWMTDRISGPAADVVAGVRDDGGAAIGSEPDGLAASMSTLSNATSMTAPNGNRS